MKTLSIVKIDSKRGKYPYVIRNNITGQFFRTETEEKTGRDLVDTAEWVELNDATTFSNLRYTKSVMKRI